ncbi:MAG: hypothetical protein FWH57_05245 [Oscillospiraceae bacterium]|nr:hypothetical protein [Oscillospiraceae bacterium]
MTRKTNHIFKVVSSVALALVMCFSMVLTTSADIGTGNSASDPAEAAITKVYMIPTNTDVPAAKFIFKIEAAGLGETGTDTTGMPVLGKNGSETVTFTLYQGETFMHEGTQYLVVQTDDILANIDPNGNDWGAGAGIYRYTIYEDQVNSVITPNPETDREEHKHFSTASYELWIYVEEDANGTLFARYVFAKLVEGTKDAYYPGSEGDGKLDPTPGDVEPGEPDEIRDNYSEIIFTNRYWKTNGPTTPTHDKNSLAITKTVGGSNPNSEKLYNFEVTVKTPVAADPLGNNDQTYKAYKVNAAGEYVRIADESTYTSVDLPTEAYVTLTSNTPTTVKLKDGERLLVYNLEVGAKVEVKEQIVAGTGTEYTHSFGPNAGTKIEKPSNVSSGDWWGFPNDAADKGPHYTMNGININTVEFINTVGGQPPTGLAVDDIPYVVLIGMAVLGIIGFLAVKSRKRVED